MGIQKTEYYRVNTNLRLPGDASVQTQVQRMNTESIPLNSASALKNFLDTFLNQVIEAEAMDPGTLYITSITVARGVNYTNTETNP